VVGESLVEFMGSNFQVIVTLARRERGVETSLQKADGDSAPVPDA
jgi:hypothetical protein